jgi:hypothetical protein
VDYFSEMLARYKSKGLLVDTNLFVLLLVGLLDPSYVEHFKRTRAFETEDFKLLTKLVAFFTRIVTTPNVLSEVSNLMRELPDDRHREVSLLFAWLANRYEEEYRPSKELVAHDHFAKFGLTDSSIIETCKGNYLVLTVDLPLYAYLTGVGVDAINFNHIRSFKWELGGSTA